MYTCNNISIAYYKNSETEKRALKLLYDITHFLSLKSKVNITFINLSNDHNVKRLHDVINVPHFTSYTEYNNYKLSELDDELSYIYHELYMQGEFYDPIVIIIHNAGNLEDCSKEDLIYYLENMNTLLGAMGVFIFCTVDNN